MLSLRPIHLSASAADSSIFARSSAAALLAIGLTFFFGANVAGAQSPEISIETQTNGVDADAAPGPTLNPGDQVTWTYQITANGPISLYDLIVSDTSGVVPDCDITGDGIPDGEHIHPGPLDAGQSFTCTASGTVHAAANGTFSTTGRIKAFDFDGTQFDNQDQTHYTPKALFIANPGVSIQSLVNGVDADSSPGPYIAEGSTITWTYIVTNTGNVPLSSVSVTNNAGVSVNCGGQTNLVAGPLSPGASATCTGTTSAAEFAAGLQTTAGSVKATAVDPSSGAALNQLSAQDAHNYTPVQLPGTLAFTGPADYLPQLGIMALILGSALCLGGTMISRRQLT